MKWQRISSSVPAAMSIFAIIFSVLAAWVMMTILCTERRWRYDYVRYEVAISPLPKPVPSEDGEGDVIAITPSGKPVSKQPKPPAKK